VVCDQSYTGTEKEDWKAGKQKFYQNSVDKIQCKKRPIGYFFYFHHKTNIYRSSYKQNLLNFQWILFFS
jgi:hypothetical protein